MTKKLNLFFITWGLLAVVQAAFTDLANDEAYYWFYSRALDWGYFDHPPIVAVFIKAGYWLFSNEVGVRLFTIGSQIAALLLIFYFLLPKNHKQGEHFILLVILTPLLHVFSFITTPDAPLLLTTVLFLVLIKQFHDQATWIQIPALAVSMALMMYSKYHGAVVILLVMASRPQLFFNLKFLTACILGALLFLPHLWWQYQHQFPSLQYHLIDRNTSFEFKDVIMFLLNQLINFNPILLLLAAIQIFKSNDQDPFEKSLRFIFIGFLSFFLLMTWRGHIEPQWTYVLIIPILYFSITRSSEKQFKLVKKSAWIMIPILIAGRLLLIFDWYPMATEFHGYPALVDKIKTAANGQPVAILNSYQLTAKYQFYAGSPAIGLITNGRRNQYTMRRDEENYLNRKVFCVSRKELSGYEKLNAGGFYSAWGKSIDSLSYYKDIEFSLTDQIIKKENEWIIPVSIHNRYRVDFQPTLKRKIVLFELEDGQVRDTIEVKTGIKKIAGEGSVSINIILKESPKTGNIQYLFGIQTEGQFFTFNSKPFYFSNLP